MKILLTTIVDNVNYGTYLQAFATAKVLKEMDCDVEILDYIRPHLNHSNMLNTAKKKGLMSFARAIPNVLLDGYMKQNLKKFLISRVDMTKRFTDWNKFKLTLKPYDLYLVGSDQVWNSTHNKGIDEVFYFGGIKGKKASYASSVGIESFPKDEYSRISSLLRDFKKISVRESFGVDALRQVGNIDAEQVLDPTLLLNGDDWKKECDNSFVKKEPYLLIYSVEVNRDKETIKIAKKIAAERGLKVYLVSPYIKLNSKLKVDRLFFLANTTTFLNLFSQADYAVVSSFHGTAFAINFNCQFVTVSPERFSTRVQSLLKLLNLEDRYVKTISDLPKNSIDYAKVNTIIDCERAKSKEVLNQIVSL